ncbi:MAG: hypothetical protein J5757_05450 [Lachnospiraceae bacterium]|nr:hypothetical protein [Lachnospiraceae bacterium]
MAFKIVRGDIAKVKADMVMTQADLPGSDAPKLDKNRIAECYRSSLELAKQKNVESVALPLIDGRKLGMSESEVIQEAVPVFRDFLEQEDMQITLVVPEKSSNAPRAEMYAGIDAYLDRYLVSEPAQPANLAPNAAAKTANAVSFDEKPPRKAKRGFLGLSSIFGRSAEKGASAANYEEKTPMRDEAEEERTFGKIAESAEEERRLVPEEDFDVEEKVSADEEICADTASYAEDGVAAEESLEEAEIFEDAAEESFTAAARDSVGMAPTGMASMARPGRTLEELMAHVSDTWQESLLHLIDEKGYTDTEVYKRANIDRKLFSKIRSNAKYQPKKNTALALALALHLNLDETKDLLGRAGYALSPSSKSDLIIRYFIENEVYDIYTINLALFDHQQPILGE